MPSVADCRQRHNNNDSGLILNDETSLVWIRCFGTMVTIIIIISTAAAAAAMLHCEP